MKRLIGVKIDDGQAHADGILRARKRLDGCLACLNFLANT